MLNNTEIIITNLIGKIENEEEFKNRNCIKVVCDLKSNALYFSREPIPTQIRKSFYEKTSLCYSI